MKNKDIRTACIIFPELPIGTELWFMKDNKIAMGLISAYKVYVTSAVDRNRGWWDQLFERYRLGIHKNVWKFDYNYEVKLENYIYNYSLDERKWKYYLLDRRVYFSKDELLKSL